MRFRCIIWIFFLLTVKQSRGAIQALCDETKRYEYEDLDETMKICFLDVEEVDDEDFTISSETDPTTSHVYIYNRKNIKFLPTNLVDAFPELNSFHFDGCSVTSINKIYFKGLTKLRELDLEFNEIENVASDAFSDLVSLERLILNNNRIKFLDKNTFISLKALTELNLNNNEIQFLHPKIFSELVNLKRLYLADNEIPNFDENIFGSLTNLEKINLSNNELERIPRDLLKNNLKLTGIGLHGNKIKFIDAAFFDNLSNLCNFKLSIELTYTKDLKPNYLDSMRKNKKLNCIEDSEDYHTEYDDLENTSQKILALDP